MSHYSEPIHKSLRLASRNLVVSVASGLPIDEERDRQIQTGIGF
jgi:hypothetical protein